MSATTDSRGHNAPPSTLVRWCRFNFVGGIGIAVQFVALFLVKSVLYFDYLVATAIAVEAAVVHNFVWHEQFTWADRVQASRGMVPPAISGAGQSAEPSSGWRSVFSAATKRLFTWRASAPGVPRRPYGPSFRRFLRFNLTNGAVSILGNLALMKVMVGQGHMNYLLANAIAIALCSLANFLVSEEWVFESAGD